MAGNSPQPLGGYAAYLFDWDGTLNTSLEVSFAVLKHYYYKYGLTPSDADISKHFGDIRSPLYFGLDESRLDDFHRDTVAALHDAVQEVDLYPGAAEVLQALKERGKKVGLVTAAPRATLDSLLEKHNLTDMFDVTLTRTEISEPKPDPAGINRAIEALGVEPEQTIMIGDSHKDLLAANNAGTDSLLFLPPPHETLYDTGYLMGCGPKFVISSWQEFLDRLQ